MDKPNHPFHELFAQLGLPCDDAGIAGFLKNNRPLAGHIALPDALFWTSAQAAFLRESLLQDTDWSQQVDQLSQALRGN
jgi:Protein of unknown function (DUF2789)